MPAGPRPARRAPRLLAALALLALTTACAGASGEPDPRGSAYTVGTTDPGATPPPVTAALPTRGRPGVSLKPLPVRYRPDLLVSGRTPFSPQAVKRLRALAPHTVVFRTGTIRVNGREVDAVAVDPATFRAFAAKGTAEATAVWQAVARGDAVASHAVAKALELGLGKELTVSAAKGGVVGQLRLGALATTGLPGSELLLDDATGHALGLRERTGVLLSAGKGTDPVRLAAKARALSGKGAKVDLLSSPAADPMAFLSGSSAARAFGAFSYRYFPDGTIQPDAGWVRNNIVTAKVPIFGTVTCHRLMVPQLRGALQDVVEAGLAGSLTTYDGCYVPRFIERNPDNSISLHTWGIAIDMDAATNYRGIEGTMDPKVVDIFKSWGFRWGGDWSYTDPMHFELGALLSSPRR